MAEFAKLLTVLGRDDDERLSIGGIQGGDMTYRIRTVATAKAEPLNPRQDRWYGVAALSHQVTGGRGKAADVVGVRELYLDLDVKPGGMPSEDAAHAVIATLTGLLNAAPAAIVYSGHGLQPHWKIQRGEDTDWPDATDPRWASAKALMKRWHRLACKVASEHGGKVDNVSDLSRVLRVPGTTNCKREPHVPVTVDFPGNARPVSLARLAATLDRAGVTELDTDRPVTGKPCSLPESWSWADDTCSYVSRMVSGWADDAPPGGRHQWLMSQATRLAAAQRAGCLTEEGHKQAVDALESSFEAILASSSPVRSPGPREVEDALEWGVDRVAVFTDDQVSAELGDHHAKDEADPEPTEGDELEALLDETEDESPWLDLAPYADGTRKPPQPEIGARRTDGRALLYRAKAHLMVAETGIGKSWFACHHAAEEMLAGNIVVYCHFEEPDPAATFSRLHRLGVPADVIVKQLRWLDVDRAKKYRKGLKNLDQPPALVVLDGVVAACGSRSVNDDDTVNWFRAAYVVPAQRLGAAVLALHHPVKDPAMRGNRGGRGSGSWINLVDGVHFQALPGKTGIGKGRKGWIDLYADKDRESGVIDGAPDGPYPLWRALGRLEVDDREDGGVRAVLTAPVATQEGQEPETNEVRELAEHIVNVLQLHGGGYPSQGELSNWLRAQGVKVRNGDVGPALQWLEDQGRLSRPPYEDRKARPGQLVPDDRGSGP